MIDCLSDTGSYELLGKECLRREHVTNIDMQDEVKCGLVTLHMQDDMLRHQSIMPVSRLDTLSKVSEEVQGIARVREAAGGVAPVQIGAVTMAPA